MAATEMLIRTYATNDRSEDAQRQVLVALGTYPDAIVFKQLQDTLARGNAQTQPSMEASAAEIETIADPAEKELAQYRALVLAKKTDEAYQGLLSFFRNHTTTPGESAYGRVLETLFQHSMMMQDWDVSKQCVAEIAKLDEDGLAGGRHRVQLAMKREQYTEALAEARRLTTSKGELAQSWVLLGQAQAGNRQLDAAILSFNKALDLQGSNAEAVEGVLNCRLAHGQVELAREALKRGKAIPLAAERFRRMEETF